MRDRPPLAVFNTVLRSCFGVALRRLQRIQAAHQIRRQLLARRVSRACCCELPLQLQIALSGLKQIRLQTGEVLLSTQGLRSQIFKLLGYFGKAEGSLLRRLQLRFQALELRPGLTQLPCECLVLLVVVAHLLLVGRDSRIGLSQFRLQVLQLLLVLA